jgi:hypothetical protein
MMKPLPDAAHWIGSAVLALLWMAVLILAATIGMGL